MTPRIALVGSSVESSNVTLSAIPLLETKLYLPQRRPGLVARPGLIERLHAGVEHKLTLVTAPPGFGKTTLLAEWLAESHEKPAGWVSLDSSDNEPAVFWAYVIEALRKVRPAVGSHALSLLHSPRPATIESVLTALINEIDAIDSDFILILDDYHVIDASPIHDALAFLLDRMPSRMHVVLASRSDPPLPLPRLRARGQLTELRATDLRFTPVEADTFLNHVMALDLSASDMAKLERRTEGWIAALKLAALSMKGRSDLHGFVEAFAGDNRYIADYLVEEVLQAQPERLRRFLMDTAILERLGGPLCDAVTGEPGSQALLEDLERRNLFVVALDDRREWYRFHHLFADVLQALSTREDPDRVRACHLRASEWYEHHGAPTDAVRHALGAADPERAAALLEIQLPARNRSYESAKWLGRVKALPESHVRARPVLSMGYAWALLNSGELEAAEARMKDVERWLDASEGPARELAGVDEERLRSLPAELASARVYLTQARGETFGTVEHAQRALALIPEGDHMAYATAAALLGLAHWGAGDLEAGHRTFSGAIASMRRGGSALDAIRGTFVLGDIRVAQGRLREAARIYEEGLQLAKEQIHRAAAPETDELHLGLSELHREWGDLQTATRFLAAVSESAEQAEHAGNRQRWCTAMAAIRSAQGDLDGALRLLVEAESVQLRGPVPRTRPVEAMKVRIWIAQGRLADAMAWVRERGLSADDEPAYLREFEYLTLARVLIARGGTDGGARFVQDAARLLDRLEGAAAKGGRAGTMIEALVLQALAFQVLGNARGALDSLERALTLAEPEGYLRVFVDEGIRMRDLLRQATARGIGGQYTRRVLAAFDAPAQPVATPELKEGAGSVSSLTARELEILRLIAAGLRNQEIADQLSISAATVKRHIANAYTKLGVSHRTEALARAQELKLL